MSRVAPALSSTPRSAPSDSQRSSTVKPSTVSYQARLCFKSFTVSEGISARARKVSGVLRLGRRAGFLGISIVSLRHGIAPKRSAMPRAPPDSGHLRTEHDDDDEPGIGGLGRQAQGWARQFQVWQPDIPSRLLISD